VGRTLFTAIVVFSLGTGLFAISVPDDPDVIIILLRGDANSDDQVNINDASYINSYLFSGGAAPPCMNQADINNDGVVNISDSSHLLNWLFNGGPAPAAPGPFNTTCTTDPLPSPGCQVNPCY
jgi:hypothetical protein